MKSIKDYKRVLRSVTKDLAYSRPLRSLARSIVNVPAALPVNQILRARGLDEHVRRLASAALPSDKRYAKLTIGRWKPWEGKKFSLQLNDDTVFEGVIEGGDSSVQISYRNIIVSAASLSDFSINLDLPYSLSLSKAQFSTQQQKQHDEKLGVTHSKGIRYAARGNTRNPTKMIVAFPDHVVSSAEVFYPINGLEELPDSELSKTLLVCLQDNYLQNGSYLTADNSGQDLTGIVNDFIESIRDRYQISGKDIMFTGRGAGGSMAILHSRSFTASRLVITSPKFNIDLFGECQTESLQPYGLLQEYVKTGRQVDYISLNNSEELITGISAEAPNLTYYRMTGKLKDATQAVNMVSRAILCGFITPQPDSVSFRAESKIFWTGTSAKLQLRVNDDVSSIADAIWFLKGKFGCAIFMQLLTNHSLPFVKYTLEDQQVFNEFDSVSTISSAVALGATGHLWECELSDVLSRPAAV